MGVDEMRNIMKAANKQAKGMLQKFEDKCKKVEVHLNMIWITNIIYNCNTVKIKGFVFLSMHKIAYTEEIHWSLQALTEEMKCNLI